MNIIRKANRNKKFLDLDFGDVFEIDDDCYIKVCGEDFNAVDLYTGIMVHVTNDATVSFIPNATLTIN